MMSAYMPKLTYLLTCLLTYFTYLLTYLLTYILAHAYMIPPPAITAIAKRFSTTDELTTSTSPMPLPLMEHGI